MPLNSDEEKLVYQLNTRLGETANRALDEYCRIYRRDRSQVARDVLILFLADGPDAAERRLIDKRWDPRFQEKSKSDNMDQQDAEATADYIVTGKRRQSKDSKGKAG